MLVQSVGQSGSATDVVKDAIVRVACDAITLLETVSSARPALLHQHVLNVRLLQFVSPYLLFLSVISTATSEN